MGATPTGATPTGPTLDPLNILVNKFNIATDVALILFLFSSWINYLLYDTKSVMVFWQLLSKIKRFVTIFRISWNGPTLFSMPIGDFIPGSMFRWYVRRYWLTHDLRSGPFVVIFMTKLWNFHVVWEHSPSLLGEHWHTKVTLVLILMHQIEGPSVTIFLQKEGGSFDPKGVERPRMGGNMAWNTPPPRQF